MIYFSGLRYPLSLTQSINQSITVNNVSLMLSIITNCRLSVVSCVNVQQEWTQSWTRTSDERERF